ncbi:MAG: hypothetical protein WC880_05045 [Candidatus Paceibacterota bacterium]
METEHLIADTIWESFENALASLRQAENEGAVGNLNYVGKLDRLNRLEDLTKFFGIDFS